MPEIDQSWRDGLSCSFDKDGRERVKASVENAFLCMTRHPDWKGGLVYDAFRDRILFSRRAPWTFEASNVLHDVWLDSDTHRMGVWLERELGIAFSREKCEAALTLCVETNSRHVVRDWLEAETWDGKPRVDALFSRYFGAEESDYVRSVSISFCIGSVARIMRPGCQLDTLPILEGDQGIGKSSGIRGLGGEWFSDTALDFGDKDSYQQLRGVWIYELSELDALNRKDVARVKAFISAPSDRYRPSYGRRVVDFPRQVAFIGTVNPRGGGEYLSDDTGNRRFLPVLCGIIDVPALRADRAQLWAEALVRFKMGEAWHLTGDAARTAAEEQDQRRIVDPWESHVETFLAGRTDPDRPVSVTEVLTGLGLEHDHDHDKFRATRAAAALRAAGWIRHRVRIDGVRSYLYHSPRRPVYPRIAASQTQAKPTEPDPWDQPAEGE
jgi:putative DNA primase/helicase